MPKFVANDSKELPPVKRYISTLTKDGFSVIDRSIQPTLKWIDAFEKSTRNAQFSLGYVVKGFPVDLSDGNDLSFYQKAEEEGVSVTMPNGIVLRVVDMLPGTTSPMHRTTSLDFGIVLKGQVEAIMDSGESVLLNEHDIFVQRTTMHAWRNVSSTERARMVYILSSAKPVEIKGQVVSEDLGDIGGVPRNE